VCEFLLFALTAKRMPPPIITMAAITATTMMMVVVDFLAVLLLTVKLELELELDDNEEEVVTIGVTLTLLTTNTFGEAVSIEINNLFAPSIPIMAKLATTVLLMEMVMLLLEEIDILSVLVLTGNGSVANTCNDPVVTLEAVVLIVIPAVAFKLKLILQISPVVLRSNTNVIP
jgi:hypothetical protein